MEYADKLPVVTVVTVVYNGVRDIEHTILSVLDQTYPNIEYLVIDGGSSDGTVDIIKKYNEKIAYWISESDGGIYFAMNKAIEKATGEWIHFRNCGDYFYNNLSVSSIFIHPIDMTVQVLHGDCQFLTLSGCFNRKPSVLTISYKKCMPVFHPSTFVRTSLMKKMDFNTKYKSSADYEFFFKCLELDYKFEYRPVLISIYNATEGFSLSNWELARREIWDWRCREFFFKSLVVNIDIFITSLRVRIAKWRRRV